MKIKNEGYTDCPLKEINILKKRERERERDARFKNKTLRERIPSIYFPKSTRKKKS